MTAMSPSESRDTPEEADRSKRLAGLLLEVARSISPDVAEKLPTRLDADPRLEAFRAVLLKRQLATLDRLEHTIDDPEQLADAVSNVLPHAIALSGARDERLGLSLAPTFERATQASIRKNPGTLVNILYPLMGPVVRKAIAESLNDTLQGLNQALRFAFSWRGLKWRLEAFRSGSSFGDIVLKHTLVYRVEHVFLIHRKSGLLLSHLAAADVATQDPQLVSGMLTAIQDFVHDSFDQSGRDSGAVDSMRLGDLLLWCEAGPQAYLATVIRGNPPETLRATLRDTLSALHQEMHGALEDYDGDGAALGNLEARLEPCLRQQVQPRERKLSPWLWVLPLLLLLAGGYWLVSRELESGRVEAYVDSLRKQPGIVVTQVERRDGKWMVAGLRDPLAVNPDTLLKPAGLDPDDIVERWEPYVALSPSIVLRRLKASLPPLPAVTLWLRGNTIVAQGGAPQDWIDKARGLVRVLPAGAPSVDLTALTDVEDPEYLRLRTAIQSRQIYFDSGAPNPAAGQEKALDDLIAEIHSIVSVAKHLGFSVRLAIVGHADSTGKETTNLGLSIGRAEVVRSILLSRGVEPELLSVRGAGTLEPRASGELPDVMQLNRYVSFTVNTSE